MAKNRKAGRKASYQNQKYQKESFEGLRESGISAGNKARDGTDSNTFAKSVTVKADTPRTNAEKSRGTKAYVKRSYDANTIAKTGAVKVGGENSFTSKSNDAVSDFAVKDTVEKGSVINANSRKATGRKLSAKLAKEKANENSFTSQSEMQSEKLAENKFEFQPDKQQEAQEQQQEHKQHTNVFLEKPKEEIRQTHNHKSHHRIQREFHGREKEKTGGKSKVEKPVSDTFFEEKTFGDKKVDKSADKAKEAKKKYQKAYRAAQKKTYSMEKVFDEKTGLYTYKVMETSQIPKPKNKKSYKKDIVKRFALEAKSATDSQVAEAEEDNSAVQAAHSTEIASENLYEFAMNHNKSKAQVKYDKVAKAQKKSQKAQAVFEKKKFQYDTNKAYEKWLDKNPHLKEHSVKNEMQKQLQKARIKRQYQKAAKAAAASAEKTTEATIAAARTTTAVAKKLQELMATHAKTLVIIGALGLIFIMICTMFVSCGAMFGNTISTTVASTYLSAPAEIDATDLRLTQMEMELQNTIDNIETDYPDYDEYDYNLGAIGHDPFTLISYLSAMYPPEFTAADMESVLQALFGDMYTLTLTPDTETRTRTVTKTDPDTGDEYEEDEDYEVKILRVKLEVKTLEEIAGGLTGEAKDMFEMYSATKGALQQFESPVDYYWYNYVSSYYGYRANPITGANEFHRGIDIAVPDGSTVYATHAGTIMEAGFDTYYGNYVVITDSNGYTTKYGHLNTLNVSAGQTVRKGKVIGKTGNTGSSTGSHLHLECLYNGEYYNPYFYFLAGTQTMYGETTGGSGATDLDIPSSYSDAQVAALIHEAENYLDMPYVWGGSSPSTGFDCSGFVCWVFKNSGTYPIERTTANGIYNKCAHISADEAKPGDIVFFQGTYNSGGPVSHVGIYCGNGIMIHCGDPIKYASINTSYWQSHFHSFGRLVR